MSYNDNNTPSSAANNQTTSSLDSLLARSWASRAALSRQAHLEPKAEEAIRQNSEEAQHTRSLLQSRPSADEHLENQLASASKERPVGMSQDGNSVIMGRDRSAIGLDFSQIGDGSNTTTPQKPSSSSVVPLSSSLQQYQRSAISSPMVSNNSNQQQQQRATPLSPSNNEASASQQQQQQHVSPSSEFQPIPQYKHHHSASRANVDTSQAPIIPTPRGYKDYFKEAAEEGGIAVLSPGSSRRQNTITTNNNNNSSRSIITSDQRKNYFPGQHVVQNNDDSSIRNLKRTTIGIDSIEQLRPGGQQQNFNDTNNNNNRSLQVVQDNELRFLHQAYGDPTLSIITHWTLLHQNLALELLARHWMMLLDASRITSKHDRTLAAAALMQLKVSNNELSQVREELATEKSKNATLLNQQVLQSDSEAHASNPRARSPGRMNTSNLPSSIPISRSGATTPTRTGTTEADHHQKREISPSRNATLNSNIVLDNQNNSSRTGSAMKRHATPDQQRKNVSFSPSASHHVLPHPSQHVPLVWSSSVISSNNNRAANTSMTGQNNNNSGRNSPQVSIGRRNSPGRIQRRDMQF